MNYEALKELLNYDPETGNLTWAVRSGSANPGDIAGRRRADGYLRISIYRREYSAHRLAWLLFYGESPKSVVFVTLKLCGVINWSWWWVLAPFWGGLALVLVIVGLIILSAAISS